MHHYQLKPIKWPDEFREIFSSIANHFHKNANFSDNGLIRLEGLSPNQSSVLSLLSVISEVDDVNENLSLAMSDIDRLAKYPIIFGDSDPFKRYKFLVRMWMYEYARYEDLFGFYTLWQEKRGLLTRAERKAAREEFHQANKPLIRIRNILAHDSYSWESHHSSKHLTLLGALQTSGMRAIDKDGKVLRWEDHISPLCESMLPWLYECGQSMNLMWDLQMADLARKLIDRGELSKSTAPSFR